MSLPILAVSSVETSAVSLLNDSESFVVAKSEKLGLKDTSNRTLTKKIAGCSADSDCRKGVCVNSKCVACNPANNKGCKNSQKCVSNVCVDACKGVSCPSGKKVKDRSVAHACTCTACLVDLDCGKGKKCNVAASSANNACANCAENEACNCPDDQVANGSGGCKCAPISCPDDGTPCGTKTLTDGKCSCAEQSCAAGKVWNSKLCRCETPCPTGYARDTSGNCTLCDVGYEKDILDVCVKADSCEALGYVTAFSTETGKECGDAEMVASSEKGPTINGQSCYKCVYKTCAEMSTGLTDDAASCNANRPYTISPLSHAVLTEYKAGSGFYLPSRTGNALVTASCVLCDSCTVYGQYCTACNSIDGCTECSKSGYSIDMQGNCTNTCSGYVENEICVPCNPGSKFKKSCSPCAAGEVCGCTGGKVSDGKGACVSCLTQQPACCGKGGMVNGCYVCDACKTDHFVLAGGVCTLQTCKQYYGSKTFNIGDSDDRTCKNSGGHHVVATKSAYPKADCSSLSSSTECGTCELCPAGQKAAKGDNDCSDCPAGYKCPSTGMLAGIACNNGKYQDQTGQTDCKTCPAGTYTPNDGNAYTACIPADCGNYVPSAGQNHQTKCAAGTYQPDTGKTSCINATCGQYVPSEGQCTVSTCPAGTYQADSKKTECIPASCGNYVPRPGECAQTKCAAGTYQPDTGKTSCIAASKGYYVPTTGQDKQTACAAGTYQPDTGKTSCINASCGNYVPTPGQDKQTQCAKGYYQPDEGKTTCIAATAGYYVPTTGQCSQTAASCGNYVPTTGQSAQTQCAAGTYQNLTAQSSCKDAACGNYVATAGQCEQTVCAAGTYQPNTKQTSCINSSAGNLVPTTGKCEQTACSAGSYQNETKQITCKTCPAGYHCPNSGMAAPIGCHTGKYQDQTGQTSCKTCALGTYAEAPTSFTGELHFTACIPADCGTYVETTGATSASVCGQGSYQPNKKQSGCLFATPGHYVDLQGQCAQKDCAAGYYSAGNSAHACSPCSDIAVQNGSCAECTVTGICTKVTCSAGYYASGTTCKLCEAGYYCTGGLRNPCNCGAYQDQTGQSTCKPCSAGSAASCSGAHTQCDPCQPGTFASSGAATGCSNCPSGTFANSAGSTGCMPCTVMSVPPCPENGPYVGGTNCSQCTASTGQCTDAPCPSATVKTAPLCCKACGAMFGTCASCTTSSCTSCPSGFYPQADASCTSNQYWEAKGTLCGQCTDCPSGQKPNAQGTGCENSTCASMSYSTSCSAGYGATPTGKTGSDGPCYNCSPCPKNYYSAGGTVACTACPYGQTTSSTGSTSYSACTCSSNNNCADEEFCNSSHKCEGLSCGTYYCGRSNHQCVLCDYCCMSDSDCTKYGSGISCINHICDMQSSSGGSGCTYDSGCASNQTCQGGSCVYLQCAPGKEPVNHICSNCVPGKYKNTTGSSNCEPCNAGYYASGTGNATCSPCAKGTYAIGSGNSSCTSCQSGYTTASIASTSSSACQPSSACAQEGTKLGTCAYAYGTCPSGWVDTGSTGPANCKVCNPNKTYNGENCTSSGGGGCTSSEQCSNWYQICSSGSCVNAPSCEDLRPTLQYRSTSGTGYSGPAYINVINKNCYIKSGGCTSDSQCASNETCSGAGACGRLSCAAGKYANNHACTNCPAGTYKSASGYDGCTACSPGTYASGTGNTSCASCAKGTYASGTGNTSCTSCPAGQTTSGTGSTSSSACQAIAGYCSSNNDCSSTQKCQSNSCVSVECSKGQYVSNHSCVNCAAGYQGSIAGVCAACPAGYYASGTGNTSCTLCSEGYYSTGGASSCTRCSSGTTCGNGAKSSSQCRTETACSTHEQCASTYACTNDNCGSLAGAQLHGLCNPLSCSKGQYASNHYCKPCEAGYQGSVAGLCTPCPVGKYASGTGNTSCTSCPSGQTTSGTGSTSSSACHTSSSSSGGCSTASQCGQGSACIYGGCGTCNSTVQGSGAPWCNCPSGECWSGSTCSSDACASGSSGGSGGSGGSSGGSCVCSTHSQCPQGYSCHGCYCEKCTAGSNLAMSNCNCPSGTKSTGYGSCS